MPASNHGDPVPLASHEQNKSQRRHDILTSARALMRASGDTAFSMRALAEQAGVSIATPYNLFGSKHAILVAVLDADLAAYQARLEQLHADGVDVLFEAIAIMRDMLASEPDFYRNVIAAVSVDGGPELRFVFSGPRYALWKKLLKDATEAGLLADAMDPDAFTITLSQLMYANVQEWALGFLDLAEMDARIRYGLALLLTAVATDASRAALQKRLQAAEADLQSLWREALRKRLLDGPLEEDERVILADQLEHLSAAHNHH